MIEFQLRTPEYDNTLALQELNYWASTVGIATDSGHWRLILNDFIKDNPLVFQKVDINLNVSDNLKSYHNWKHMTHVVSVCMQLANYYKLNLIDRYTLFISAMFHDYKHSFGQHNDEINIDIAIYNLTQKIYPQNVYALNVTRIHKHKWIKPTIEVTKYPFDNEPITLIEKIIRDADLTMCLSKCPEYFAEGLANELNLPEGTFSQKTMLEFALSQTLYTLEIKTVLLNLQISLCDI
jgi:hypothetical protein